MTLSRRKFSAEFKLRAVRQVEAGASVAAVARRYEIHPTLLSKWRQPLRRDPERAFQRDRQPHDEQVQVSEREQMVGGLTMENALLKKALARLEEQQLQDLFGKKANVFLTVDDAGTFTIDYDLDIDGVL